MAFDVVTAMWAIKKGKGYTDSSIGGLAGGFKYKGSVATMEDLPSDAEQGDQYTVGEEGSFVWDGSEWKPAGIPGKQGRPGPPGPAGSVDTVNGKSGPDVILTGSDIDVSDAISDKIGDVIPEMENEIAGKQDQLGPNSTEEATAKLTKLKIDESVYSLAGGGSSVYADYPTMITDMNSTAKGNYEIGWNIYIRTVNVPDLWISKNDETTSVPYTYVSDAKFIEDLDAEGATGLQIGYYRVNQLETGKVYVPVEDVKVNGTTIVQGGVADIPVANSVQLGVVKVEEKYGIGKTDSYRLQILKATDAEIAEKSDLWKPIVPANLQLAVDTGVKGSTNYTSFTVEKSDGTTGTLKLYCELT